MNHLSISYKLLLQISCSLVCVKILEQLLELQKNMKGNWYFELGLAVTPWHIVTFETFILTVKQNISSVYVTFFYVNVIIYF